MDPEVGDILEEVTNGKQEIVMNNDLVTNRNKLDRGGGEVS